MCLNKCPVFGQQYCACKCNMTDKMEYCWYSQFGRIPVLEESVTSHFFCSCENTQKSVKIIERNWCLMLKAPYQSLGAISGNFEQQIWQKTRWLLAQLHFGDDSRVNNGYFSNESLWIVDNAAMLADMKCKYTFFLFCFLCHGEFSSPREQFSSIVPLINVVFGKFRRW